MTKTNPELHIARINLGGVFMREERYDAALRQFFAVLREVEDAQVHGRIGSAFWAKGRPGAAIHHMEEAYRIAPDVPRITSNLAWMLATCPQPSLRDPERALQLVASVRAQDTTIGPRLVDTEAAALAAVGWFDEAARIASVAIRGALDLDHAELAAEIRARRDRYRSGLPYIEVF